jgi:hypothetical protein
MALTVSIHNKINILKKWTVFLMFFNFGISQWAAFDIQQEAYSSVDLRTFIESTTFGLSANPAYMLSSEKRVNVGMGFSRNILLHSNRYQNQFSGWFPKFSVDVFITNNLYLIGRLSQFYSNEDIIQFHNYGFALTSGEDDSYPWQSSVVFCNLAGPRDFALRSVSLKMITRIQMIGHQVQMGIGKEMYSTTFYINDVNFPSKMKGEINYLLLGMQFERNLFRIMPQIRLHPRLIGTSVRMTWGIG